MLGRRFGLLRVTAYAGRKNGRSLWHCICDCGRETDVPESSLKNGNTTSCGCKSKATDYLHFVDTQRRVELGRLGGLMPVPYAAPGVRLPVPVPVMSAHVRPSDI